MKTTHIYGISDLEIGKFVYVGKGNTPHTRFKRHLYKSDIDYLREYIREKGRDCFGLAILETVEFEASKDWIKRERFWVKKLRATGHPLLNRNAGGTGPSGGYQQTEESNAKRSESHKKLWTDGKRAEQSERMKGKNNPWYGRGSEMSGENHSGGMSGKHHTDESKAQIREGNQKTWTLEKRKEHSEILKQNWTLERRAEQSKRVSGMSNPMYGKHHTEAWRQKHAEGVAKPYPAFYNISTSEYIPARKNLCKLCRESGLSIDAMGALARGTHKQSKEGWRLATEDEIAGFNSYDKLNGGYCQ